MHKLNSTFLFIALLASCSSPSASTIHGQDAVSIHGVFFDSADWDHDDDANSSSGSTSYGDANISGFGIQYEALSNSTSWILGLESRTYENQILGSADSIELRWALRRYFSPESNFQPFIEGGARIGGGPELTDPSGITTDYDALIGLDFFGGATYFFEQGPYLEARLGYEVTAFAADDQGSVSTEALVGFVGHIGLGFAF